MLPIELICEIPCKLVHHLTKLVFMKTSSPRTFTDFLTHAIYYGKTLFFRYWRNLLRQQSNVAVHSYAHYKATHMIREKRRSSLKWVVQVRPDLT